MLLRVVEPVRPVMRNDHGARIESGAPVANAGALMLRTIRRPSVGACGCWHLAVIAAAVSCWVLAPYDPLNRTWVRSYRPDE